MEPTIGRIVHYHIPAGLNHGGTRPAIIVNVHSEIRVNLVVFLDGPKDEGFAYSQDALTRYTAWVPSVVLGADPGPWQWPEKKE